MIAVWVVVLLVLVLIAVLLGQVCTMVLCADVLAVVFVFVRGWFVWRVRRLCDRRDAVRPRRRLQKRLR